MERPIAPPPIPRKSELEKRWEHFIRNVNWEQFTGVKLFAWLGGLALFCGAAFFVKYSIDRNLIPPAVRLAVGALVGLGLIIWSLRVDRKKFATTVQILAAGGIGVLYTVAFAATHIYHYLPNLAGLALLAVISFSAFVLAVFLEGVSISTLGALGAYAAPVLLSTGQVNLPALFIYLAVVNAGVFEVVRRLKSAGLFLLSVLCTLFLLFLGAWSGTQALEIAGVALANLALFSLFLFRMPSGLSKSWLVKTGGYVLFLAPLLTAIQLLSEPGFYPLALATMGVLLAVFLAFQREEWAPAVIPYNILAFLTAMAWVLAGFNAREASWEFLAFFLFGVAGGLGPVLLVRKYGLKNLTLDWFKVFPVASLLLTLLILLKNPETSVWFWPMVLGLHLIGMFVCFLIGSVLGLSLLACLTLLTGFVWILRTPLLVVGPVFYLVLLGAGMLLCVGAMALFKYLPKLLSSAFLKPFLGESRKMDAVAAEWMAAFPALGAFLLLGTAFLLQSPLTPHPGMATALCFLVLALFLGKRISSAPLVMTALAAFALAQSCWMLRVFPKDALNPDVLAWSGFLWLAALVVPFLFFRPAEKQNRAWQAWALFEAVQALYFLKAADTLLIRDVMGWFPLGLFLLKLPGVKALLDRLKDKAERNGILAFHGGVLLFYLSCVPILLLDYGWLGLALVFESMALLWLNRRIEHPGLPWVSAFLAPAGFAFLVANLEQLKSPGAPPILNWAVGGVALAVVALVLAARLAPPLRRGSGGQAPPFPFSSYFLWLAVGSGFFLANLMVADWFGGQAQEGLPQFQFFSNTNLPQFVLYSLLWSLFGAVLWRAGALPRSLRFVGLLLLSAGWLRVVLWPYLFQPAVLLMRPFLNLGLLATLSLLAILAFLILKPGGHKDADGIKPFFIGLFVVLGLITLSQEGALYFQPGRPYSLLFNQDFSLALAMAFGWTVYGAGLFLWPRPMDKPFRIAGLALAEIGLLKTMLLPFHYDQWFGKLDPVLNIPSLVFFVFILGLVFLTLRDHGDRWPWKGPVTSRRFWGVTLGLFSFFVLNVEVVELFGRRGLPFTFLTYGSFAHQLAYSLGWLLYAMVLLWVGIHWKSVRTRWASLILFFLTTLKIFFMDLWRLGQLYRVASFVGLAAVLILVSFLYQKFLVSERKK
jgi:uncharacterized membrane protein